MMKDTFSNMHPFINFIFFALTIGFTMFIMNPVCLAVSFLCALVTALYLNGKKAVRLSLVFLLPMILLIVLVNPVFNHEGMTILTYFPWDNPLTLESIVYGIASAFLLSVNSFMVFFIQCSNHFRQGSFPVWQNNAVIESGDFNGIAFCSKVFGTNEACA